MRLLGFALASLLACNHVCLEDEVTIEQGIYGLVLASFYREPLHPEPGQLVVVTDAVTFADVHGMTTSGPDGFFELRLPLGPYGLCPGVAGQRCITFEVTRAGPVRVELQLGDLAGTWSLVPPDCSRGR